MLADLVSEEEESSATDNAAAQNFNLVQAWAVNENRSFHAATVRYFSNGDAFFKTVSALADDANALKSLGTLFASLDNLEPASDGISRAKLGDI